MTAHTDLLTKPTALEVRPDNIPARLKEGWNFVLWKWTWKPKDQKWDKPPRRPDGSMASVDDPDTWITFNEALAAYKAGGWDGIGIVLIKECGIVGIDQDSCVDYGAKKIQPQEREWVDLLDSYTEVSPSGSGLRTFAFGALPPAGRRRQGNLEIYDAGRYLTLTGHRLNDSPGVMERSEQILELHHRVFGANGNGNGNGHKSTSSSAPRLTDAEVLDLARKARNGAKVERLLRGDTNGYQSDSEADLALLGCLRFYSQDAGQLERLWKGSGLYREKLERVDYVQNSIANILANAGETYSPSDAGEIRHRAGARDVDPSLPYAISLDDFIARKLDSRPPLLGTEEDNILPVGGLLVLFAKGGNGKTTLTIDAAMHLASGVNWLGFEVQQPLRVLIVENEGPQEPFRKKLAKKRAAWTHQIGGEVFIKTLDWGACTLAESAERTRLRDFIEQERIELVIGDPLDSLGIEGVGSPAETRAFMKLLVEVGLTRDVAFWLLHHPLKDRSGEVADELDQASGAWGGRPDTMLRLVQESGNRARLSFPKVRWGGIAKRGAYILAFDPDTEGFEVVAVEDGQERDLLAEIKELLKDGEWRTPKEIAAAKKPKNDDAQPGVGTNDQVAKKILETHPDAFISRNGKELGRSPRATFWTALDPSAQLAQFTASGGERGTTAYPPPFRGVGGSAVVSPPVVVPPAQSAQSVVAEVAADLLSDPQVASVLEEEGGPDVGTPQRDFTRHWHIANAERW